MNWFIFLSVLLVFFFQEGQCCLKRRSTDDVCECSDFLDLEDKDNDGVLFTEGTGCVRNATCGTHAYTFMLGLFNFSEIASPSDLSDKNRNAFFPTVPRGVGPSEPTGPPVDLFPYFGIICENSKWYATKYPVGIDYNTIDGQRKYFGQGGEFDGKKSLIQGFTCQRVDR